MKNSQHKAKKERNEKAQVLQHIAVLDAAMDIHKRMMIEDSLREAQK